nr:hypothetical protein [Bradyrhizobium sp. 2S1]
MLSINAPRQGIAGALDTGHATLLHVPFERRAHCIENARHRFRDLWTNPVTGYQRRWNFA